LTFVRFVFYDQIMNIESAPSPAAAPAGNGPDAGRWESAAQMPVDAAAMREFERAQLDEMSAIALDALRVLRIEILDPDHAPTDIPGTRVRATDPTLAYVRLTRSARLNLAARARMAADDAGQGSGETPAAAALRCQREQRLVIEMSAIGMDFMRVVQQEILDSYHAPTEGQGLWMHAGDPARSIEQLSRAIRLNHAIRAKIADGTLGQRRRAKPAAPSRPARPPEATPPAADDDAMAAECEAMAAGDQAMLARLREIAEEVGIEADDVETGRRESESEDLWSEADEDLDRESDEFGFLEDLLPDAVSGLVRREFERFVGIYTRRDRHAAPDDPLDLDPDDLDPDDPDEDQDLPVLDIVRPLQALLDAIPAQDGPAGELRRLTETLEATARLLRPPGHDPP
jgi:8-oxo-dGTP pyrophosphatase MutT (NUDIX family)